MQDNFASLHNNTNAGNNNNAILKKKVMLSPKCFYVLIN